MLLRPSSLSCRLPKPCLAQPSTKFHTFAPLQADNVNYYEVLQVPTDAPQSQIKKQFYALSKAHHPDLHPNSPNGSQKFVEISDAYAVLGNPSKRVTYDRENLPSQTGYSQPGSHPAGSHSSSQSGPFGARPASGLSKKRGTFRGPPPSFYRSGGWGTRGDKRKAAQDGGSHTGGGEEYGPGSAGWDANTGRNAQGGGFSAGQNPGAGWDDVPHFDRAEHYRRNEELDERGRERARMARQRMEREREREVGGDMMLKAVVVTGALVFAAITAPKLVKDDGSQRKNN